MNFFTIENDENSNEIEKVSDEKSENTTTTTTTSNDVLVENINTTKALDRLGSETNINSSENNELVNYLKTIKSTQIKEKEKNLRRHEIRKQDRDHNLPLTSAVQKAGYKHYPMFKYTNESSASPSDQYPRSCSTKCNMCGEYFSCPPVFIVSKYDEKKKLFILETAPYCSFNDAKLAIILSNTFDMNIKLNLLARLAREYFNITTPIHTIPLSARKDFSKCGCLSPEEYEELVRTHDGTIKEIPFLMLPTHLEICSKNLTKEEETKRQRRREQCLKRFEVTEEQQKTYMANLKRVVEKVRKSQV